MGFLLSNEMQLFILEIHDSPLGIYLDEQSIYKNERSFFKAMAFLQSHEIINRVKIPVLNKTRVYLTAKGKMFALLFETMRDQETGKLNL